MKLKIFGLLAVVFLVVTGLIQPTSAALNSPSATPDLTVTAVEVSQGIQDLGNNMPVISKRRTIIRGYVQNLPGQNVAGITARAKVYRINNGQETLLGTLKPGKSTITVLGNGGLRSKINDSFWFYLHKDWTVGQVRIEVEVNHNNAVSDSNQANDVRSATVNFKNANALNLLMMPLHIHNNGGTYFCGPACEKILLNVIRFHPISTLKAWAAEDSIAPAAHGFGDDWYPASTKKDRSKILDRLAWARGWRIDPVSNLHYYGMLHPNHGTFGIGRMDNYVAMGTMNNTVGSNSPWNIIGGTIMAHELGHNKNLKHVNCNNTEAEGGEVDPNYPWPYPNCKLSTVSASGYYGLDVYYSAFGLPAPTVISNDPAIALPQRGFPMMGYQNPGYISPWEYCKLMPKYGVPCSWPPNAADQADQAAAMPATDVLAADTPVPASARPAVEALRSADDFAMISGVIDDTDGTVELNPFYVRTVVTPGLLRETIERRIAEAEGQPASHRHADGSLHQHAGAANDWKIAVVDAAGTTVYSQTVAFGETAHDGAAITAITDLIPLPTGSKTIRITRNGMIMAQRTRSANAPIVELDEPAAGALEAGDVLTWEARDLDGDPLMHTVLYSPDSGQAWYPLALDTPTTALTLTEEMLRSVPGGAAVQLKVVTSDGLNTGEDTTTSTLTAANHAPTAIIASPMPAFRAAPGDPVVLSAQATDWEDSEIAEASFSWTSDRDGLLGAGSELVIDSMSAGKHTITLTVTDSGGAHATATVEITIASPYVYIPLIQR